MSTTPEPSLAIVHCAFCLATDRTLATCQRCTKLFCNTCSSPVSPQFCKDCLVQVEVTDKTFTKTETEYDEINDTIIEHKRGCREISFAGADWVFYSEAIHKMSDEQLKAAFEFHRAVVSQMEAEMTQRVVKKMQVSIGPATRQVVTRQTTTTKTTKPKTVDLAKLAASLKKMGITPEMIAALQGK